MNTSKMNTNNNTNNNGSNNTQVHRRRREQQQLPYHRAHKSNSSKTHNHSNLNVPLLFNWRSRIENIIVCMLLVMLTLSMLLLINMKDNNHPANNNNKIENDNKNSNVVSKSRHNNSNELVRERSLREIPQNKNSNTNDSDNSNSNVTPSANYMQNRNSKTDDNSNNSNNDAVKPPDIISNQTGINNKKKESQHAKDSINSINVTDESQFDSNLILPMILTDDSDSLLDYSSIHVLSAFNPRAYLYKNFLSEEECEYLRKLSIMEGKQYTWKKNIFKK